jgi:hypothetical protein
MFSIIARTLLSFFPYANESQWAVCLYVRAATDLLKTMNLDRTCKPN